MNPFARAQQALAPLGALQGFAQQPFDFDFFVVDKNLVF